MKKGKLKKEVTKLTQDKLSILVYPNSKEVCLAMLDSGDGMRAIESEDKFRVRADDLFFIHTLFYESGKILSLEMCLEDSKNREIFERLARQDVLEYISFSEEQKIKRIMGTVNSIKGFAKDNGFEI